MVITGATKRGYMLESGSTIGSVYAHKPFTGCPQMMAYSLLQHQQEMILMIHINIFVLLDLGKYNHPKLLKKLNNIKQKADKQISWKLRYATSCRYRDWNRVKGQNGYYIWGVEYQYRC